MPLDTPRDAQVRQTIDDLIQTATTYDVAALDQIYHDSLHVMMIDQNHTLNTTDKDAFKALFASKRDAGDPPMNTWAKFHNITVDGDTAHVLLSRKNDLSGVNMDLTLSIDLIFEDDRWQVTREVIVLRPEGV
ncbi:nuclear transport factor 2 family protein [uncultured Roseobacter sp.]|uniref:nuclear transport factor 2 family protein n=1 Tax=uncultured Roseobacter sp. TaxID=114847 RepID=UPI00260A3E6E|nr:nuclear transport factor 2 family protein [uncultured Roseobacter sp.]